MVVTWLLLLNERLMLFVLSKYCLKSIDFQRLDALCYAIRVRVWVWIRLPLIKRKEKKYYMNFDLKGGSCCCCCC